MLTFFYSSSLVATNKLESNRQLKDDYIKNNRNKCSVYTQYLSVNIF